MKVVFARLVAGDVAHHRVSGTSKATEWQLLPGGSTAPVHPGRDAEAGRQPAEELVIDQERNAPEDRQSSRPWVANPRESASWRRMQ